MPDLDMPAVPVRGNKPAVPKQPVPQEPLKPIPNMERLSIAKYTIPTSQVAKAFGYPTE